MPGVPSSGAPRERSQARFRDGTVWGLKKGPLRSIFWEILIYRENRGTRRGGLHVVKQSFGWPPGSLPLSQSLGTGPNASCGFCCPLCPTGNGTRGKFVLSNPCGNSAEEACAGCPYQRYATGVPVKAQGLDLIGIAKGSSGVPGPRGQYLGKIRFYRDPGVQDEGGRHMAKRSSDSRVAYPEVKVQVRDLVRVVGIVAPLP